MRKSFNMHTARRNLTWTLMLLLLSGVLCSEWKILYPKSNICAVKGSFVVVPCLFYYPNKLKVQSVKWAHERDNIYTGPFIFDSESNKNFSRYQYIGDTIQNCSLEIHQVEHNDAGKHFFRFSTNSKGNGWTGRGGSRLQVVDLKIVVKKTKGDKTMKEGDSVNLTCMNTCDSGGRSSAFTWFKNGEPINEGRVLYFRNISSTNSGNYSCSLKTLRGTTSGATNINVEYGPKNTSVSIRPSTEVDAGSNITLICSSNANPAVKNYTWFKMGRDNVIVANGPELNLREIHPRDSGQFLCSVSNKHGHQKSTIVSIKVKAYWPTFTRDVLIIATVATLLIGTTVIVIRRFNKKRSTLKTSQETEDIQNAVYVNWAGFENSHSQEVSHCEGATEVIYATVDFSTKRKSKMQQRVDSHDDDDDEVIYSTICRDRRS